MAELFFCEKKLCEKKQGRMHSWTVDVPSASTLVMAKRQLLLCIANSPQGSSTITNFYTHFLDASTHLYKRVCPSVRWSVRPLIRPSVGPSVGPERVFFNEPITGLNGRKWLGKLCNCSQLVKMSSELSLNVPKCLKMSQNVKKCRKMSRADYGRKWSEMTGKTV